MERYENGKIYRLIGSDGYFYIGSTCMPLYKRLWNHKAKEKQGISSKVYQHFRELGWDNVRIILIEEFACQNKQELLLRESQLIQEQLDNEKCLNCHRPLVDPEQRRVERLQQRQEWREINREKDRAALRRYYDTHKDQAKKYAQEHPRSQDQKDEHNRKQREKYKQKKGEVRNYERKKITSTDIEDGQSRQEICG